MFVYFDPNLTYSHTNKTYIGARFRKVTKNHTRIAYYLTDNPHPRDGHHCGRLGRDYPGAALQPFPVGELGRAHEQTQPPKLQPMRERHSAQLRLQEPVPIVQERHMLLVVWVAPML